MRRSLLLTVAVIVLGVGLWWLFRDHSHLQPSTDRMERIAGTELTTPPRHHSSSLAHRLYEEIWITIRMWSLPVPNMMVMRPTGDVWTYAFTADPDYRPPASSPLACRDQEPDDPFRDGTLRCDSEPMTVDGHTWRYTLSFDSTTTHGTIRAALLPD